MKPRFEEKKDPKGKIWLYGVFRPEGMQYGKNGIRKVLCLLEDAVYKETKRGRVVRSIKEYDNFTQTLFFKKLQEILQQNKKDKQKKATSIPIQDAFQRFLDEEKTEGEFSKSTIESYTRAFNFYLEIIGNHPINDYQKSYRGKLLNALHKKEVIEPMTKKVLKVGLGPVTINSLYFTKYNAFFAWAADEEITSKQFKLKRVKEEKKKMVAWSTEAQLEIERLLFATIDKSLNHNRQGNLNMFRAYLMIAETGMRRAEVWSLPLAKIDLFSRIIKIRSVPEIDYQIKESAEKDIPISSFLAEFLKSDLENRNEKEVWFLDNGSGDLHFKRVGSLTKKFTDFLTKHKFYNKEIKPLHGFRSRALSIVIQNKGLAHAQLLAGHHSTRTTEKYLDAKYIDMDEALDSLRIPTKLPLNSKSKN